MKDLNNIIANCLKQNRNAQQQLYKYTYTELSTATAVYSKDASERDWIFNLGMLKVLTGLDKYQTNTNYLGWARTILVRTAIDHHRKNKNYLTNMSPVEIETQHFPSDDFEAMMNSLDTEAIVHILQQLPEKERLVFSMYELDGYSHKEIEKLTGIKSNTSKWLLAKSKKSLREIVNKSKDSIKLMGNGE